MWIVSGLFYCTVIEIDLALPLVNQPEFERILRQMVDADWSTWSGNEAVGLMKMMELSQCEGAHNLIQGLTFGRRPSKRDSFQGRRESFSKQAKPVYL